MYEEKTMGDSVSVLNQNNSIKPRFDSIDILRGIIMVLMALDHTRDFFTNVRFDPLDMEHTNVALFFTRWITHFCAPVFVFLAGTGAFLSLSRGKSKSDLRKFLITRGIWLIFLELTIVRFGWLFNFDYSLIIAQVIWAIGWSMIFLSFFSGFSPKTISIIGIIIVLTHNLFDGITPEQFGSLKWLWVILHVQAPIQFGNGNIFFVFYPLIPWIGVMAAGYGFGNLFRLNEKKRNKIFLRIGLGLTAGFIILRYINIYGDPSRWSYQKNFVFTFLDFLNTTKYPPSFLYLLMTLGPAIALLPLLDKATSLVKNIFVFFGRVPMFYYLVHIPLIHLLALLIANALGLNDYFLTGNHIFDAWPNNWGYDLPIVYFVWIIVVISLYPVCRRYSEIKKKNKKNKLLSYL